MQPDRAAAQRHRNISEVDMGDTNLVGPAALALRGMASQGMAQQGMEMESGHLIHNGHLSHGDARLTGETTYTKCQAAQRYQE